MSQTLFEQLAAGALPVSEVYRDAHCFAFMDIHPMSAGHVLVCPLAGVATLAEVPEATRARLWEVALRIAGAQQRALGSRAQNFRLNDGRGANQSVPHVHIHVIPRYRGDSLRTLARIASHIAVVVLAPPISARKRARLDALAARIRAELPAP